jgi:hypothetical protein
MAKAAGGSNGLKFRERIWVMNVLAPFQGSILSVNRMIVKGGATVMFHN